MEKSTAPRARFIAAILLFAAVVIGDLILSRGYLAQGPATWPVFLLAELVMLALLVIGGILFCLLLPLKLPFFPMFLIIAGTVTGIRLLAIHFRIQLPAAGHAKP